MIKDIDLFMQASQSNKTPSKDSISMNLVKEALGYAVAKGIDIEPILQDISITPHILNQPDARLAIQDFAQLWVKLADAMNDEFFGLDHHPMRRGSYLLMSKLSYTRPTLKAALKDMLYMLNVFLDDLQSELVVDKDVAKIVIHDRAETKPMFAYATYLMLIHTLLCWLANQRIYLTKIEVCCVAPLDDQDYRVRFCPNIHYLCGQNIIYFDANYLSIKIQKTSQDWYQFLKNTPQNLLMRYKNPESFAYQIRQCLNQIAPEQWPELNEFALKFNMSDATLQRRLKKEGLSYQQLKNDMRCDLAKKWLEHTSLSLSEISARLGFHDVSAFSRAFKHWTDQSAGQYRSKFQNKNQVQVK